MPLAPSMVSLGTPPGMPAPTTASRSAPSDDLVAGREHRLGLGDHDVALPQDPDDGGVGGQPQLVDGLAHRARTFRQGHLHDRDVAAFQSDQPNQVADGDGFLHHGSEDVRRRDRGIDAPLFVEEPLVLGVVHARQDARDRELLLGEQRGHQVVLVVAGGRHHDFGLRHLRFLEHPRLAGVAEHDVHALGPRPQLVGQRVVLLDQRHIVAALHEVDREMASHGPTAGHDHLHA